MRWDQAPAFRRWRYRVTSTRECSSTHPQVSSCSVPAPNVEVVGSPITTLYVKIDGGTPIPVPSIIDSGGVTGTIPSYVIGSGTLPANTNIEVYTSPGGDRLYAFNTNDYRPTVISSGLMNTGFLPFRFQPVYIDYSPSGIGTTVFDHPA